MSTPSIIAKKLCLTDRQAAAAQELGTTDGTPRLNALLAKRGGRVAPVRGVANALPRRLVRLDDTANGDDMASRLKACEARLDELEGLDDDDDSLDDPGDVDALDDTDLDDDDVAAKRTGRR